VPNPSSLQGLKPGCVRSIEENSNSSFEAPTSFREVLGGYFDIKYMRNGGKKRGLRLFGLVCSASNPLTKWRRPAFHWEVPTVARTQRRRYLVFARLPKRWRRLLSPPS